MVYIKNCAFHIAGGEKHVPFCLKGLTKQNVSFFSLSSTILLRCLYCSSKLCSLFCFLDFFFGLEVL